MKQLPTLALVVELDVDSYDSEPQSETNLSCFAAITNEFGSWYANYNEYQCGYHIPCALIAIVATLLYPENGPICAAF